MKLQTTQKQFAFIIMMLFSAAILNAQECPICGGKKVFIYKCVSGAHKCDYPCPCGYSLRSACIPQSQAQKYYDMGYTTCFPFTTHEGNRAQKMEIESKTSAKVPADNSNASNKVFRR